MKKNIISLIITSLFATSLIACGKTTAEPIVTEPTDTPVTISEETPEITPEVSEPAEEYPFEFEYGTPDSAIYNFREVTDDTTEVFWTCSEPSYFNDDDYFATIDHEVYLTMPCDENIYIYIGDEDHNLNGVEPFKEFYKENNQGQLRAENKCRVMTVKFIPTDFDNTLELVSSKIIENCEYKGEFSTLPIMPELDEVGIIY